MDLLPRTRMNGVRITFLLRPDDHAGSNSSSSDLLPSSLDDMTPDQRSTQPPIYLSPSYVSSRDCLGRAYV
jgi:hypothetical protein